jgi:hypothetical protein
MGDERTYALISAHSDNNETLEVRNSRPTARHHSLRPLRSMQGEAAISLCRASFSLTWQDALLHELPFRRAKLQFQAQSCKKTRLRPRAVTISLVAFVLLHFFVQNERKKRGEENDARETDATACKRIGRLLAA